MGKLPPSMARPPAVAPVLVLLLPGPELLQLLAMLLADLLGLACAPAATPQAHAAMTAMASHRKVRCKVSMRRLWRQSLQLGLHPQQLLPLLQLQLWVQQVQVQE